MKRTNASVLVSTQESDVVAVLHELDLGHYTLFILEDQSINLFDLSGEALSLADNGIHLDSLETYRLFISLREMFQ